MTILECIKKLYTRFCEIFKKKTVTCRLCKCKFTTILADITYDGIIINICDRCNVNSDDEGHRMLDDEPIETKRVRFSDYDNNSEDDENDDNGIEQYDLADLMPDINNIKDKDLALDDEDEEEDDNNEYENLEDEKLELNEDDVKEATHIIDNLNI